MRIHRVLVTAGVVALSLVTVACQSKTSSSSAPPSGEASTTSAAAPPATTAASAGAPATGAAAATATPSAPAVASGSGSVTFDGAYSGSFTSVVCIGSGPTTTAHFNVTYAEDSGTSYTGDMSSTEFGFRAPDGTDFDSGFLSKALDTDGKGFALDGIAVKDQESGKSVTMHGTLRCP